jgi:hypothetical protein
VHLAQPNGFAGRRIYLIAERNAPHARLSAFRRLRVRLGIIIIRSEAYVLDHTRAFRSHVLPREPRVHRMCSSSCLNVSIRLHDTAAGYLSRFPP